MSKLDVTLIDVGHGDCIFIEAEDANGVKEFALIDCPDSEKLRPGLLFVKRRIERLHPVRALRPSPLFKFVLMTHAHKDHCLGLHRMMYEFGTNWFLHGRSATITPAAHVFKFARRSPQVGGIQQIDSVSPCPVTAIGAASLSVLHPDTSAAVPNENDNSVVIALQESGVTIVLTGDVETGAWGAITLPGSTKAFKAPHHGAASGTLRAGASPWIPLLAGVDIGVSCHTVPHGHPDAPAVAAMALAGHKVYRTDEHGDITFSLHAGTVTVKCWQ
jgi:beta-lactamase superfamily II metal-dependent hydrolase